MKDVMIRHSQAASGPSANGFIFVSYSTKDKHFAGSLKDGLTRLGFEVFVAHDDLVPSKEWQREIRKALRRCDEFIPVLTKNFRDSVWTDQETGYALARGGKCVIVPLLVPPVRSLHGFLSQKQGLKNERKYPEGACHLLVKIIEDEIGVSEKRKDRAIRQFADSDSYAEARENVKALLTFETLSPQQMNKILTAAITNSQICNEAYRVRSALSTLVARHECSSKLRDRYLGV
jgi:hypothetical protein